MLHPITKKILMEIEAYFDEFENQLNCVSHSKEFKKYLSDYRGMYVKSSSHSFEKESMARYFTEGVIGFFEKIFSIVGLSECSVGDILDILTQTEESVNLILYYWFGLNDRNYQFRTLIHFFDVEGIESVFLTKNKHDFSISLNEYGIRFGLVGSEHEPKTMATSRCYELRLFDSKTSERVLLPRIRSVQREICLLIDEWEHLNSILAVEYGKTYHEYNDTRTKKSEEIHKKIVDKMNIRRDYLAKWCLSSFCDFQEWIEQLFKNCVFSEDIKLELDATACLLLSSLQKIFLPASVSRHKYCDEVPKFVERFALSRVRMNNDDFSSKLMLQAVQSAMGKDFSFELFDIINLKPFEWSLTFDPSAALKSFSWSYSRELNNILATIYGICCFKKAIPNTIDNSFLSEVASILQMPDSFTDSIEKRIIFENKINNSLDIIQSSVLLLLNFLDTNVKVTKHNQEVCQYIKTTLQLMKVQVE